MTAFTKGQEVFLIQLWSRAMEHKDYDASAQAPFEFYVRRAVVLSCGKKQMVLHDAHKPTECLGRNYKPAVQQHEHSEILGDTTLQAALARAEELAERYRLDNIASCERSIERNADDTSYVAIRRRDMAHLQLKGGVVTPYEPGHKYGPAKAA